MSQKPIVLSTTNEIAGWTIISHLDIVSANIVSGTNIFKDISASFSDAFGGRSKSYQNEIEKIDKEVIKLLKSRASDIGADGIIGMRIDHDDISGGGKSMFMVTVSGTAVRAKPNTDVAKEQAYSLGILSPPGKWKCQCGQFNPDKESNCSGCGRAIDSII